MSMYDKVCHYIRVVCGLSFSVRPKGESALMGFIGAILFFNPSFMTNYTTTLGSTVYFPDNYAPSDDAARTLAHEGWHVHQAKHIGRIRFSLAYMFPQILAPLALLAVFAIWWTPALLALVFLAALAPLPAPWRAKYEREAYLVTAVLDAEKGWNVTEDWYTDYMVNHYVGFGYYKMAWLAGPVRKFVNEDMKLAMKISKGETEHFYITPLLKAIK